MNNVRPESLPRELHDQLDDIGQSLKVLATVQALSCLHPSEEIKKLARRYNDLNQAHASAIEAVCAQSDKLKEQYGDKRSYPESLVKEFGESEAKKIQAGRVHAQELLTIHYRELKLFTAAHPHIQVLSRFLGPSEP